MASPLTYYKFEVYGSSRAICNKSKKHWTNLSVVSSRKELWANASRRSDSLKAAILGNPCALDVSALIAKTMEIMNQVTSEEFDTAS